MSSSTSSTTLSIPRSAPASSNAAIRLLAQVYLPGQSLEITEADGSELSLTTGPSGPNFQAAVSTLLESAGQSSQALGRSENKQDVERWIAAATDVTKEALDKAELDQYLQNKTYIAGGQLTAADVAVCGSLAGYMAQASHEDRLSHPSVTRHFDLVQNTASVVGAITKLSPNTIAHAPVQIDLDNVPVVERKYESSKKDKKADKEKAEKAAVKEAAGAAVESDLGLAKGSIAEADAEKKEGRAGKKEKKAKAAAAEGAAGEGKAAGKKEKGSGGGGKGGAAPAEPEVITPGLIDLRVGRIVEVKKHPDADSLYVEQIDIGEAEPRTVVSGLVNYIPIEEMQGKMLIAVCNLKPASMRGIKSFAMVLAATSPDGKEGMGSVELVAPPEGSNPGDRVYFEGFESVTALEQLPPKKKIFETIQPGFTTLETREAAWVDPTDKSKVTKIRTEKGYCKAPNFVGASLS